MSSKNLLGLFVKFPEPGKVKTRLANHIGSERASSFCRRITEFVLENTAPFGSSYKRIVFYSPAESGDEFRNWIPDEVLKDQKGDDLGERMHGALSELFALGAKKAIIIGADIPGLHKGIIDTAFRSLEKTDIVIGPAMDGGYYLIGMKSSHPELFRDITWSTGEVFSETVNRVRGKGLRYCEVETLFDVDCLEDFLKAEEILKKH